MVAPLRVEGPAAEKDQIATATKVTQPAVWVEWGRITRFLESARLAFARERDLWTSAEFEDREEVRLVSANGRRSYSVSLEQHVEAVNDEQTLYASVLIHSYAIAEAAAARKLGVDSRTFSGIEDWGERLLEANAKGWDRVADGRAGLVEVAVIRNAFAHGTHLMGRQGQSRLARAGAPGRHAASPVTLSYDELRVFRGRLKSLLNAGSVDAPVDGSGA